MKNVKTIAIVVAALLIVIVALQNTEAVDTRVLFFTVSTPRVVLLAVTFLIGAVTGLLVGRRLGDGAEEPEPATEE